jgi:hypothetical protein
MEKEPSKSSPAWIRIINRDEASEELVDAMMSQRALYPPEYAIPVEELRRPDGSESASIVMSHSLIPKALYHAFALYGTLLSPDLPLSRTQHEMIASTVSSLNTCHY